MLRVFCRNFSTKGSKKTKRLQAEKRAIKKSTPPKLPWYLHKQPPKWFTNFVSDKKQMAELYEKADLFYHLLRQEPPRVPIEHAVSRLKRARMLIEREKFESKMMPRIAKRLQEEYKAIEAATTQALSSAGLANDNNAPSFSSLEKVLLEDKSTDDQIVLNTVESKEIKLNPLESVGVPSELTVSSEKASSSAIIPTSDTASSVPDRIEAKSKEMIAIEWTKFLLEQKTESSAPLVARLAELDSQNNVPSAELGVRLIFALQRENDVEKAWDVFKDFTSMRNIWSPALVEAGITLCGRRGKPERALNYFEMAELRFGKSYLPLFYHPTMLACALVRGTTPYTFHLYERMTKVNFIKPNEETLSIVLKACSTLGDVSRAQDFWKEIVEDGEVVPDEDCVVAMLNCYARGNRMLRAKTLKKSSIKVLNFRDKGLLAQAAGFTPAKIDRTDEARRLIRELEGRDPNEIPIGDFTFRDEEDMDDDDDEMMNDNDEDEDDDYGDYEGSTELDLEQTEEQSGPNISNEHVRFISGFSPERVPDVTPGHYQTLISNLVRLSDKTDTSKKDDENSLVKMKPKEGQLALHDETTPGRRQESNIQSARALVETVREKSGQPVSLKIRNAEIRVVAEALRLNRTVEMFKALESDGPGVDRATRNIMIDMFCRAQRVERAKEYYLAAKESGDLDKLTVGPMIDGLARVGKIDEAFAMFKEHESLGIMERHIRFLRIKLRDDARLSEIPVDPNAWRSRENISRQLRAVGKEKRGKRALNFMLSAARS